MLSFQVPDMTCGHCAGTITRAIREADPAARVDVSLAERRVRLQTVLDADAAADAIREAGYSPRRED